MPLVPGASPSSVAAIGSGSRRQARSEIESRITGVEAPQPGRRPVPRDLEALRRRLQLVAELRDDDDARRRSELDDGSRQFIRPQVLVTADEPCDRDPRRRFRCRADIRFRVDEGFRFPPPDCRVR